MSAEFALAPLSALALSPPELVEVASRTGYRYIGIRLTQVTPGGIFWPLQNDKSMLRATRAALRETGVRLLDVELFRMGPETRVADYEAELAAAAELGARHVLTHGVDPDQQRGAETFAAFCDLAANYSLTAEVEPVTWLEVGEFTAAAEMVRRANRPNAGVMIDSLHFFRSRSTVDQLASVPQQWFRYVQIADAPGEIPSTLEGLLHTAREARLAPGEGDLDIAGLLRRLPNIPIALEIPNRKEVEEIGYEAHCAKIRRATERLVASL